MCVRDNVCVRETQQERERETDRDKERANEEKARGATGCQGHLAPSYSLSGQ